MSKDGACHYSAGARASIRQARLLICPCYISLLQALSSTLLGVFHVNSRGQCSGNWGIFQNLRNMQRQKLSLERLWAGSFNWEQSGHCFTWATWSNFHSHFTVSSCGGISQSRPHDASDSSLDSRRSPCEDHGGHNLNEGQGTSPKESMIYVGWHLLIGMMIG